MNYYGEMRIIMTSQKSSDYKKVNKESKDVLEDYTLELRARGLSDQTIYQYVSDIKYFYIYAMKNFDDKFILDLKRKDFRRFFLDMQSRDLSTARINRMQSSLRNLLEYCEMDDDDYEYYTRNQMKGIKSLAQVDTREIFFLTDEQITYLIIYYLKKKDYQRALYISLSYDSACRRGEISQVEKHSFMEKDSNSTNLLRGKGNKHFRLFYMERTRAIAEKYLEERGEDDIDELFISTYGGSKSPLHYKRFYDWTVQFRKVLKEAYGDDININPHSFRHSAIENYYNGSHINLQKMKRDALSLDEVRVIANHEDISTTRGYMKDRDEEIVTNLFSIS